MPFAEITKLINLANEIAPPGETAPPDPRWLPAIQEASTDVLIGLAGALNSEPGKPPAKRKALREAVISEIERKNSELIKDTMMKLDEQTIVLNRRMFWIAVAGIFLAIAQIVTAVIPLIK